MASSRLVQTLRRPRPLLRAVLELVNALNGLRPLSRNGYLSFLVFWFGWPTSELPTLYLGASAVDMLRRGLRGDFKGQRGFAALTLTAASWVVLALIRRRVVTSGPLLQDALRRELGSDYTEALKKLPTMPSPTGRPSAWRTTVARRRYVNKQSTVQYGPHGRANLADIWRRRDLPPDGKAPVLVQVPGGGWAIGMRRPQAYPLMSHFADRGWICVSLAYRVSPRHTWPDHIIDIKRALSWVKANIASFGGDPDFVAITGGSAGGHLASLAALSPNDPSFQPGFEDADTSVVAGGAPGSNTSTTSVRGWLMSCASPTPRKPSKVLNAQADYTQRRLPARSPAPDGSDAPLHGVDCLSERPSSHEGSATTATPRCRRKRLV